MMDSAVCDRPGVQRRIKTGVTTQSHRSIHFFDCAKLAPEMWANGGGMTRTIAKRCADDHTVDWRVSVATLNGSAKFSLFPGLDRTLLPLDEGAVDLHSTDGASIARPGQPVRFSGDLQIWASVSAQPVNVLNVMTRRGAMMEGKCRSCTAARGPVTAVVRSDRPTIVS